MFHLWEFEFRTVYHDQQTHSVLNDLFDLMMNLDDLALKYEYLVYHVHYAVNDHLHQIHLLYLDELAWPVSVLISDFSLGIPNEFRGN